MLKIMITQDAQGPTVVLSGRLVGPWVEELRRCESFRNIHFSGSPLIRNFTKEGTMRQVIWSCVSLFVVSLVLAVSPVSADVEDGSHIK